MHDNSLYSLLLSFAFPFFSPNTTEDLIKDLKYIRDHPGEFEQVKRTHLNDGTVYLEAKQDLDGLLTLPVGAHITLINNNGTCEFERSGVLAKTPKLPRNPYFHLDGIADYDIPIRLHGEKRISWFTIYNCVVGYRVDRAI